jgi:hypothetical protein
MMRGLSPLIMKGDDWNMNEHQVRIRYAGSVLVKVKAENEAEAQEKGEGIAQEMDSDAFLSALEPQHLGTEVVRLCSECRCEDM